MSFKDSLLASKQPDVIEYLKNKNLGKLMSSNKLKILILMDATGSMSNLLQKAKNTVAGMILRAIAVLLEVKISENCF
jgi:hypothetical protein